MLFDLHIHQSLHSGDSILKIDEAIEEAKDLGLNGICITDHDDLGLREQAAFLSKKHDFLVIVGVEIYTLDGDLLCYGIEEMPDRRMTAQETIDFVRARGGVCIAAHPYRHNNRGLKDKMLTVSGLHAIEGYNGRTDDLSNEKAVEVANSLNIPITGGSDSHKPGEIGNFVTQFEDSITDEGAFIEAIKSGRFTARSIEKDHIRTA